jgi:hypothetical protein
MVAQERANRILAAWVAGSADRFKVEIEGALLDPQANAATSTVENEERELLESIALNLWSSLVRRQPRIGAFGAVPEERLQSDFALLQHLTNRSDKNVLEKSCAA